MKWIPWVLLAVVATAGAASEAVSRKEFDLLRAQVVKLESRMAWVEQRVAAARDPKPVDRRDLPLTGQALQAWQLAWRTVSPTGATRWTAHGQCYVLQQDYERRPVTWADVEVTKGGDYICHLSYASFKGNTPRGWTARRVHVSVYGGRLVIEP